MTTNGIFLFVAMTHANEQENQVCPCAAVPPHHNPTNQNES